MAPPTPTNIVRAQISIGVGGAPFDVAIVAGTSGQQILVLALALVADAAVDLWIQSEDDTALYGDTNDRVLLAASSILVLPYNEIGWMLCSAGDDLEIKSNSVTAELAGCVVYTKI